MIFLLIWQPPAFPYRHQYSIIGRFRLNHRVRDVDGLIPAGTGYREYVDQDITVPDQKERPDRFLDELSGNPIIADLD